MSRFLELARPSGVRIVGSATAIALALVAFAGSLRDADAPFVDQATAVAGVPIVALLGWVLAHRAVAPGWRSGVRAASVFALTAVVAGSFAVAAQAAIAAGGDVGAGVGGTIALGLIGLVFFGIPTLAIGLVLALAWVGLLRLLVSALARAGWSPA
jgi:hypothetical protein